MATAPESSKHRASRIPLDYHRRGDRISRFKLFATVGAMIVSAGYIGWTQFVRPDASHFSHGPLASVHARWENDCNACHTDFQPVRSDAWAASWSDWQSDLSAKCQMCHQAPVHQQHSVAISDAMACSDCHQEHQGREASLTRTSDAACTSCHADLKQQRGEVLALENIEASVTSFSADHPEFRSLKTDPGNIKFPHRLHLMPGQRSSEDGVAALTVDALSEADQQRYGHSAIDNAKQTGKALVTLDCVSCHRLDDSWSLATQDQLAHFWTTGSERGHMLPVTYERDCKACHPLTVNPDSGQTIPHGLEPTEILELLRGAAAAELISASPSAVRHFVPRRPVPGQTDEPETIEMREALEEDVRASARHVQHTCQKCHYMNETSDGMLAPVRPANLPTQWLKHARFDHRPHRSMSCKDCHAQAADSDDSADVMISGRSKCMECHAPATSTGMGGARHDCVECHDYHHRTVP